MKKNSAVSKKPALDKIYRVLSACSIKCLFRIARILTLLVAYTNNQLSRQTRQNIQLCFPDLAEQDKKSLIQRSLLHTSCAFFELAALWYHPLQQVLGYINEEQVDSAFQPGKRATIVVAPHHGSWELLNLWLAHKGPLYSLYKASKKQVLNDYVLGKRMKNGAQLVAANTSGLRSLLQALKNNNCCMVLPDQKPAENTAQVNAPFFGYNVRTSLLIKRLAIRMDCDIFIAAAVRDLGSARYQIRLKTLQRDRLLADDLLSASYLNQSIEEFIGSDISQYQWAYRRFNAEHYKHNLPL